MLDSLKNYILGLEIQYCTYAHQADVYNGKPRLISNQEAGIFKTKYIGM